MFLRTLAQYSELLQFLDVFRDQGICASEVWKRGGLDTLPTPLASAAACRWVDGSTVLGRKAGLKNIVRQHPCTVIEAARFNLLDAATGLCQ